VSGSLSALRGVGGDYLVVTVASIGGGIFGFQNGSGAIDGVSTDAPLRTAAIDILRSNTGGVAIQLQLTSVVASNFFKRIAVQSTAGVRTVLLASDATYSNPGGTKSLWAWAGTALWDAAGSRIVEVSF
jgi:hypothetical protein